MSRTIVGLNDPKAVKNILRSWRLIPPSSPRDSTMTGVGENAHTPVQMLTDLSKQRGDSMSFDLVMQLRQMYTEGDDTMAGNEEEIRYYSDSLLVNQMRHGMKQRRQDEPTAHDSRSAQDWPSTRVGLHRPRQGRGCTLCTRRALAASMLIITSCRPASRRSLAMRCLRSTRRPILSTSCGAVPRPCSAGILGTSQQFDVDLLNRNIYARANTVGGGVQSIPPLEPCKINGEDHHVVLMHTYQDYAAQSDRRRWLGGRAKNAGHEDGHRLASLATARRACGMA